MTAFEEFAMTEAAVAPLQRARKLARFASGLALVALIAILVVTVVRDIALPLLINLREMTQPGPAGSLAVVRVVLSQFVETTPNLILVWALGELRVVLNEYAAGRFFTTRAAVGVRKTGEAVLWAVGIQAVLAPTLLFYLGAESELGMRFTTFSLALAAIGLFVMLMGRVLEAAAAIKADSDQIV
jgi:hypothetical protein